MDAISEVFIRRYKPFNTLKQEVFLFKPNERLLCQETVADGSISGWLIDYEIVISGSKKIIYFEYKNKKYIAIGEEIFFLDADTKISHINGFFTSKLVVIKNNKKIISVVYLTPWWRFVFDDGSHTDLQFPLNYFTKKWNENKLFFNKENDNQSTDVLAEQ